MNQIASNQQILTDNVLFTTCANKLQRTGANKVISGLNKTGCSACYTCCKEPNRWHDARGSALVSDVGKRKGNIRCGWVYRAENCEKKYFTVANHLVCLIWENEDGKNINTLSGC
ncbi:MAG: hypothetical protein ACHQNT_11150 [Bacteroidia bacterium]